MRPLEPAEMAQQPLSMHIARRLREFHNIPPPPSLPTQDVQLFNDLRKWCA